MNIFVFEHICGGGMVGRAMSADLPSQGLAMLEAAALDLAGTGARVTATRDHRIEHDLEGIESRRVDPDTEVEAVFDGLALRADTALVIAPEFNGILARWIERLERLGVTSLGSSSRAVALCADKLATATHLIERGIPTPPTTIFHRGACVTFPAIIKPRFGAGCENTFLCRSAPDAECLPPSTDRIVQPEIPGTAASVSFIVHGGKVAALPPGRQMIAHTNGSPARLCYRGGSIPIEAERAARATAIARLALSAIAGLGGFVGVDVVLGRKAEDDRVIEINPRLTLSYTGLRRRCRTNLAAALLDPDAPIRWSDECVCFGPSGEPRHD